MICEEMTECWTIKHTLLGGSWTIYDLLGNVDRKKPDGCHLDVLQNLPSPTGRNAMTLCVTLFATWFKLIIQDKNVKLRGICVFLELELFQKTHNRSGQIDQ